MHRKHINCLICGLSIKLFFFRSFLFQTAFAIAWLGLISSSSPSVALADDNRVVRVSDVRGSVTSFLKAAAVNGNTIEPTDTPQVDVGDVVTFRVDIENNYSSSFFNLHAETSWGRGLDCQGLPEGENIDVTYDEQNNKISAVIPNLAPVSVNKPCFYTFDLKVTGYENLYIRVYTDELYTCEAIKTYHVAVKIKMADIDAGLAPSFFEDTPDLAMVITPECCRVLSPDIPVYWTAYVINRGSRKAHDVRLNNKLGRNLRYVDSQIDGREASPIVYDDEPVPGATALLWRLGDMAPSEIREIAIRAYPIDNESPKDEVGGYFNSLHLSYGDGVECCNYRVAEAPCFILPDKCFDEEVFEKCGRLHGFFSITQMYKSNLYRTAKDPEGVWATYFTPGIWAAMPGSCERIVEIATSSASPGGLAVSPFYPATGRVYQGYLLYSPQYEIYHGVSAKNKSTDKDMLNHRADAYFRYDTRNRFSLRTLNQLKLSHDSISSRELTIDDGYKTNLFHTLLTFDPTKKFRLRLDYSNFYLNYDDNENSRADRMDNSWAAYGFFRFTPKTSIFANYEYADIGYDSNAMDSREKRLYAGLRWELTEKTGGQIKGGHGTKAYDHEWLSDTETWMAELQLDHQLTPRTRLVLNAYRRYDEAIGELVNKDDVPQNFTKTILTHFIGLSVNYDLTAKIRLNLDGTYFYDAYKDEAKLSSRKERQDKEFAISPAVRFDFMKWLSLDLSYIYTNRDSNYSQFDHEDHTVFLRANLSY